jgi:3-hydroxyisobutyrate dehydrogenase-like beta-hydroxyacid dehydrogenase
MAGKARIGFIGVGLMGHGAAKNILERGGYPLTILANRNREPVDDLVRRGAHEAKTAAELASQSDIVILCLPSSIEVEATIYGENGALAGLASGATVIDATTADPAVTRRIGADLAARGVTLIDAALGRTPKEAEEGKLSTYVGGEASDVERLRPLMETYADTIVHCGPLGAGTTCKLVNNSITIGMVALFAEGFATAAKVGVDFNALCDVLSAGGADGRMWKMISPWIREGDDSGLRGPIRIAAKDIRTYGRMAENAGSAVFISQAINQTLRLVLNQGYADAFLPRLPGILAAFNGTKIRDL